MRASSGLTQVWRLWRHCLCRFGCYPLFVVPFIAISCGLALFSSFDCEYMRLNVGFQPANNKFDNSSLLIGFWSYQSNEKEGGTEGWRNALLPGCKPIDNAFEEAVFAADRTWNAARIAAIVSASASLVAFATCFLLNICPIPVCFVWPGILLPSTMTAMFAESIKFLAFDSDACKGKIWTDGRGSLHAAEGCSLGRGSLVSLAAIAMYFICVVMICFKFPHRRRLDPSYGKNTSTKMSKRYIDLEKQDTLEAAWSSETDEKSMKQNMSFEANAYPRNPHALSVNVMRELSASSHGIDHSFSVESLRTPQGSQSRIEPMTPKTNNMRALSSIRSEMGQHAITTPLSCRSNRSQLVDRSALFSIRSDLGQHCVQTPQSCRSNRSGITGRSSFTEPDMKKVHNPYRDESNYRHSIQSNTRTPFSDRKKANPYVDDEHEQQEEINPNVNIVCSSGSSSAKKRPKRQIVTNRLTDESSSVALTPSTQNSKFSNYAVDAGMSPQVTPTQRSSRHSASKGKGVNDVLPSPQNTRALVPYVSNQLQPQQGQQAQPYNNYTLENTEITIPRRGPGENQSVSGVISELGSPTSQARRMLNQANKREIEVRKRIQKGTRLETLFQEQKEENKGTMERVESTDESDRTVQSNRTGTNSGAIEMRMY